MPYSLRKTVLSYSQTGMIIQKEGTDMMEACLCVFVLKAVGEILKMMKKRARRRPPVRRQA